MICKGLFNKVLLSPSLSLLQLDWVFARFDNARCPLLQNKPKMFFIQACRGGWCSYIFTLIQNQFLYSGKICCELPASCFLILIAFCFRGDGLWRGPVRWRWCDAAYRLWAEGCRARGEPRQTEQSKRSERGRKTASETSAEIRHDLRFCYSQRFQCVSIYVFVRMCMCFCVHE